MSGCDIDGRIWRSESGLDFHQVLIGPLDSEEQHHKTGGQQLPEEQDDPEHHIGFTIDLLCIRLKTQTQCRTNVTLLILLMYQYTVKSQIYLIEKFLKKSLK